jgi:hypothetical protein
MSKEHLTAGVRRPGGSAPLIAMCLIALVLVVAGMLVVGLRASEGVSNPVADLDPACAAFREYQSSSNGDGAGEEQMLTQIEAVWGLGQLSRDPAIVEASDSLRRTALSRDLTEFGPARQAMDSACTATD